MIDEVLKFWFEDHGPKQWWAKDENFDRTIRARFMSLHQQAAQGELFDWRDRPEGRLAEVMVLDQFSRNLFRGGGQAFAYDGIALVLAQEAVRSGDDLKLAAERRSFIYMPYMHSESAKIHEQAVKLFAAGAKDTLEYELKHKTIIDRFGRYPHRNGLLGRESTAEENEFLQGPDSSF